MFHVPVNQFTTPEQPVSLDTINLIVGEQQQQQKNGLSSIVLSKTDKSSKGEKDKDNDSNNDNEDDIGSSSTSSSSTPNLDTLLSTSYGHYLLNAYANIFDRYHHTTRNDQQ